MRASSPLARARRLPSWGCWSSPYRSSTRMTRTPELASCEPCWPGARSFSWSTSSSSDRGLDRRLGRLRAIKHGDGNRRPAGDQTADTEGKAGGKFLPQLSDQNAELRVRDDFRCGLLGAARPRGRPPVEHPECRAATCFGPCHCGFLWQRSWPGMGGHRDNPAGMRSRLNAAIGVSILTADAAGRDGPRTAAHRRSSPTIRGPGRGKRGSRAGKRSDWAVGASGDRCTSVAPVRWWRGTSVGLPASTRHQAVRP
jgi:hypothetical protein